MRGTIRRLFTDHPASIGESYTEHARHASAFGLSMLCGAAACFAHALIPALCTTTASRMIAQLHLSMTVNRGNGNVSRSSASQSSPDFLAEHI